MSYTSKYTGQEIDNKLDKIGEIGTLDSVYCGLTALHTPSAGTIVPFTPISGNMQVTDGKVKIKAGQSVQINVSLSYQNPSNARCSADYEIKDVTNNITIQKFGPNMGVAQYEHAFSTCCQYTNNTDVDCEIAFVTTQVYVTPGLRNGYCTMTVHEISRAMVIDKELPVASTEILGGIKVGEGLEITEDGILSALGGAFGSQTILFEGKHLVSAQSVTESGFLSDNIKKYDYVTVTIAQEANSGTYEGWLLRPKTFLVDTFSIYIENITTNVGMWYCSYGSPSNPAGYQVEGNFGDGTQIVINAITKGSDVTSRNHYVTRVVGIKLGSSGGSSYSEIELLSQPLAYTITQARNFTELKVNVDLLDSIENYDELVFTMELGSNSGVCYTRYYTIKTSNIIYNNSEATINDGSHMHIPFGYNLNPCGFSGWFKTNTRFWIVNVGAYNLTGTDIILPKATIRSIKGIKY